MARFWTINFITAAESLGLSLYLNLGGVPSYKRFGKIAISVTHSKNGHVSFCFGMFSLSGDAGFMAGNRVWHRLDMHFGAPDTDERTAN